MTTQLADHISKAAPSPWCEVVDLIVPWFEVQEGDLVLSGGQLCQLERMWPSHPGTSYVGVRLLHGGRIIDHYVDSNSYTAVRRYAVEDGSARCSFCGEHITLLGGSWTTDDGTTACTDTSAPYVPHKPKEG